MQPSAGIQVSDRIPSGKKRALREQKAPSPEELVREFFERVDPSAKVDHAVLPYMHQRPNLNRISQTPPQDLWHPSHNVTLTYT